jgi:uncharacterized protein (DUF488 family)
MKIESDFLIYSIGTSNRLFDEFLELLLKYYIQTVVDVRSFPTSKFIYFGREHLEKKLPEKGIIYKYLGKELGGFRKGGYINYMKTEFFNEGIKKLEDIGRTITTAFFCAERFPWNCHRRWIAEELIRRGWKVIHIIEKEKLWIP